MPCNACRMPVAAMESCVWRGMSNEEERVRIKSDGDNEQEMVAVWIRNLMRTNGSCVHCVASCDISAGLLVFEGSLIDRHVNLS